MNKIFAVGMAFLLAGCSHSALFVGRGRVITLNQSGLSYINREFLCDLSKENESLDVEFSDAAEQKVQGGIKVKRKLGKVVSGYLVDLSEKDPEAVQEYLKK